MFNRKNLIVLAAALSIGAGTFAATAPASAASSFGFATLENSVDGTITKVKGGHKGGHGHGHGGHGNHRPHHGRHHGGHWGHGFYGAYFGYGCFLKTYKEWDPYEGGWNYYQKRICS